MYMECYMTYVSVHGNTKAHFLSNIETGKLLISVMFTLHCGRFNRELSVTLACH